MKKYLSYTVVCIFAAQLASCVPYSERNFVDYCIDGFRCLPENPQMMVDNDDGAGVVLRVERGDYIDYYSSIPIYEEFGDSNFGEIAGVLSLAMERTSNLGYYSLYPYPSAVEITSDTDWDDAHPVGSPLGDCFEISYYSIADYIDHRYDEAFSYTISEKHVKLLSELAPDDLRMVLLTADDFMKLTPVVRPQAGTVHRLTVVWTMHDGTECVSEVEVEF